MAKGNIYLTSELIESKDMGRVKFVRGVVETFRTGGIDEGDVVRNLAQKVWDYFTGCNFTSLIADPLEYKSVDGVTVAEQKVFFLSADFSQVTNSKYSKLTVDDFYNSMVSAGILVG